MKKKWLPIFVIFQVLNVMFCSYLINKKVLNMCKLSRIYIGLLVVNIIAILVITVIKPEKKKKLLNKRIITYLVLIFIFSLISACFAINKKSAFFGFSGRYEGFFQIMYYFSLFLLTTFVDKKDKKKIVYAIVFSALIECIYAIFQVTETIPVFTQYQHGKPWATGFTTNPNFFGTLMLIGLSYSIGLFIDEKEKKNKYIYASLITLFMIGLLISNTLSVLVGLFVVYIYVLIYCIKNKKKSIFIILTVVLLSVTILIHLTGHTYLMKSVIKTKDETIEIAKGNIDDKYGTKRIYIWRHALWVVPKNLLHGVGIDNFYYAFGNKPLSMGKWFFDKVHNEYLQILVCEGIFALIAYLLFFTSITFKGVKNSFKRKEIYLILPVIGYLVQAFFNISVIEVAPFFYVALGLLVDREEKERKGKKIGIIGHFGGKKEFLDGQTIKTKEINNYIEKYFNTKTDKFDTYKNKRNPLGIIPNIISLLRENDTIVIVIATRGYKLLLPIIMFFNKFYKRDIYDFVVGGTRYKIFKENNRITENSKKIKTIYVETEELKKKYNKVGLNNVEVISNFKDIEKTNIKKKYNNEKIKVCTFSRIIKEKGIEDGIESVIMTNKELNKDVFSLDIYGSINKDYKKRFESIIENSPKYINYKGAIPFDKSVSVLENYDLMLFLTYYKNEGFAGTLIDAFNSGLPIIATDWNNNFEILEESKTAIKVKIKNPKEVSNKLIDIYNNINILKTMRENVLKEVDKYNKDKEMKKFVNII